MMFVQNKTQELVVIRTWYTSMSMANMNGYQLFEIIADYQMGMCICVPLICFATPRPPIALSNLNHYYLDLRVFEYLERNPINYFTNIMSCVVPILSLLLCLEGCGVYEVALVLRKYYI